MTGLGSPKSGPIDFINFKSVPRKGRKFRKVLPGSAKDLLNWI